MSSRLLGCVLFVLVVARVPVVAAEPRDPVRLRVGTLAIDGSRYMKDIRALGKEIERRTRSSVQLDWVPGGQLGDDAAMAGLIARGKLDGGGLSETGLQALVPEMAVWGAPGLFHTYDDVDRATAALDATVRDLFAKRDLELVMWADLGFSHLYSAERISSLGDVLQKAAPWLAMPVDGKLTEAITSGRARTWALPPLYMLVIGASKARYTTNLRYRYVIGGLVFSRAAWSRLSASEQATVLDVCREWEPRIRASWRKETERGLAVLAKSGVTTRAASEAEVTAFVETSAKLRAARMQESGLAELGAAITSAIAAR